jgi:hypothetical protein
MTKRLIVKETKGFERVLTIDEEYGMEMYMRYTEILEGKEMV